MSQVEHASFDHILPEDRNSLSAIILAMLTGFRRVQKNQTRQCKRHRLDPRLRLDP